jgi:hypothetical protein
MTGRIIKETVLWGKSPQIILLDGVAQVSDLCDMTHIEAWICYITTTGGVGHDGSATNVVIQWADENGNIIDNPSPAAFDTIVAWTEAEVVHRTSGLTSINNYPIVAMVQNLAIPYVKFKITNGHADVAVTVHIDYYGVRRI